MTAETLTEAIARYGHKDAHYIGGLENAAQLIRLQALSVTVNVTDKLSPR